MIRLKTQDMTLQYYFMQYSRLRHEGREIENSVFARWYLRCLIRATAKVVHGSDNQLLCDCGLFYNSDNKDHQLKNNVSMIEWRRSLNELKAFEM